MKDRIPFYNIVNMFFVGAIFLLVNILLFNNYALSVKTDNQLYAILKDWSVVTSVAIVIVVYELGFILNRVSSVLVAPILEITKIWPKEEYDIDVSELTKAHPKAQSMITDLVLMRTHILMYFILAIEALFSIHKIVSLVCILLIVLFVFSGRKHNARINIMRKSYAEKEAEKKRQKQEMNNFLTYDGTPKETTQIHEI